MAACIREQEVAAATCDAELGVVRRTVQLLKGRVATNEDGVNTAEAQACKTLDRMSKLRPLVEILKWTDGGEQACVARLVNAEFVHVLLVITAALSESEGAFCLQSNMQRA